MLVAALAAGGLAADAATPPAAQWSAPATLSSCGSLGAARVLFPQNKPTRPTGPGAIVWSAGPRCPGGTGARVAPIGAGDVPGPPMTPLAGLRHTVAPVGWLSAASGPHGQIAIAGSAHADHDEGLLIQGVAGGSFRALGPSAPSPQARAMTTAYLGDVALTSSAGRGTPVQLQIERYFARSFGPPTSVPVAERSPIAALTVAMDFRTDSLLAWAQNGEIYACDVPGSGVRHPLQRIAPAGSHPHLVALLSDDNRGILMWLEQHGSQTSVYMDYSSTGVRFGTPRLLERYTDPDGLTPPAGGLQLIRLSSESVMAAWAGAAGGHWVLRTAPIDQRGLQQVSTISNPEGDALLSALAPGPKGEALVLWTQPQPYSGGRPDLTRQALLAARGIDASPGKTIFGQPEPITAPGPLSGATLALDPANDRAVAVWQGQGGAIDYSIRPEDPAG